MPESIAQRVGSRNPLNHDDKNAINARVAGGLL